MACRVPEVPLALLHSSACCSRHEQYLTAPTHPPISPSASPVLPLEPGCRRCFELCSGCLPVHAPTASPPTCDMLKTALRTLASRLQCKSIIARRRTRSHKTSPGRQHSWHDSGHCAFMNFAFFVHCKARAAGKVPRGCTSQDAIVPCLRAHQFPAAQQGGSHTGCIGPVNLCTAAPS